MKHEELNRGFIFRTELKSGFQSIIINEIEIVMRDEKTNMKNETAVSFFVLNLNQVSNSIMPSITNEDLNLIKIVIHDEKMNTEFRTALPKIIIVSL